LEWGSQRRSRPWPAARPATWRQCTNECVQVSRAARHIWQVTVLGHPLHWRLTTVRHACSPWISWKLPPEVRRSVKYVDMQGQELITPGCSLSCYGILNQN
jgi:hypothetical protein